VAIPDSERAKILDFWREGLSASQIVRSIGHTRSRNAVIGVIYRAQQNDPSVPRPKTTTPRKTKPAGERKPSRPVRVPQPREDEPEAIGPVGDFPDRKSCQYPRNEDGEPYQACGHPGYPWCPYHASICYPPTQKPSGDEAANHQ